MTEQRWMSVAEVLQLAQRRCAEGALASAEDLCRRVLKAQPTHAAALQLLGIVLHRKGDLEAAIDAMRGAVAADGGVALYHSNLGEMCRQAKRLDEAISEAGCALALEPRNVSVLNNLGIARYDRDEYELAAECYQRAIEESPSSPLSYNNLGNALLALGRAAEAPPLYQRALALDPDYVEAHSNFAMALLITGDFEAGWRELEWRHRRPGRSRLEAPPWEGEAFTGRTLLILAEEGHGDSIQFMRYLPAVAERGGDLVVAVHRPLVELTRRLVPGVEVVAIEKPRPRFDLWCPMMSLPRVFGTTLETVPSAVPYLTVDPATAERWRARLAGSAGLKIGLVWSGAAGYGHNSRRAIAAERLAPLLQLKGVSWFSLQVGERAADLARLPAGVVDLSPELSNFSETAGALEALDLVITTDTAVPHLAGALARPAWVMLAFVPDWRWMLDRDGSPWYPTLRLFRQGARGAWDDVVRRVGVELRAVLEARRDRLTPQGGASAR
ncbi:MAG TPA: tetratricopeptide repeat protein [Stellaceae bacterium]|nr:tetratricopeptide repeat protein [Stellaceae bacterium]